MKISSPAAEIRFAAPSMAKALTFNIDRHGDGLWEAFTSTGLTVPDDLNSVRRSIFADESNPMLEKYYDQIGWFTTGVATCGSQ